MIKTHEGKALIYTDENHKEKISKELEVFYNPQMKPNRDLTILFMNACQKLLFNRKIYAALPLGGSGVRAIRLSLETKDLFKELHVNDISTKAIKNMKKNFRLSKIKKKDIKVSHDDANLFLMKNDGFDYIDLDPFGSPNKFLDTSIAKLSRNGILAVTATDTAPLAGTFPRTCLWKYWAKNYITQEKHEIGLRILVRKVQMMASHYQKELIPIFCYAKDHYYRATFICKKGKIKASESLKKHKDYLPYFNDNEVGPLWTGQLNDVEILEEMKKLNKDEDLDKFLSLLIDETEVDTLGFIDLHEFFKVNKIQGLKHDELIAALILNGFKASRTHFSYKGIKTNASLEEVERIAREELDIAKKIKKKIKIEENKKE